MIDRPMKDLNIAVLLYCIAETYQPKGKELKDWSLQVINI